MQLCIESIWYQLLYEQCNEYTRKISYINIVRICFVLHIYNSKIWLFVYINLSIMCWNESRLYTPCDEVKIHRNGYKNSIFFRYKLMRYGTVQISKQLLCCFINFRQTRYTQAISFNLTIASTTRLFIQQHFIKIKILFV